MIKKQNSVTRQDTRQMNLNFGSHLRSGQEFKMPSIPFNVRHSRQKRDYVPHKRDELRRINEAQAALKQRQKEFQPNNCNEFRSRKRMSDILDKGKSPSMMNADGKIVKRQSPLAACELPIKQFKSDFEIPGISTVTKLSQESGSTAASIAGSPQFLDPQPVQLTKKRIEPTKQTPQTQGQKSTTKRKVQIKRDRQITNVPQESVLGKRYTKPFSLEQAELGTALVEDKNLIQEKMSLYSNQNGQRDFTQFDEAQLINCFNLSKVKFDMNSLETVYDNDTDDEQIQECKSMLSRELYDVINYFVKEDPLKFVENLEDNWY